MKLIVICGEQNSGKTTILNALLKNGNGIKYIKKYRCINNHFPDFVCTIRIKGKQVGIVSKGDTSGLIDEGFNYIKPYISGIDFLICTCHKSMINYSIKKYSMDSAIIIPKIVCNKQDNALCLNEILKNI